MNPNESLSKQVGNILRYALNVELYLEEFLINYYFDCPSNKIELFQESILFDMKFDRKINCFEKICDKEKINAEQLLKDIRYVQKTRNNAAHYLSEYRVANNDVVLRKKTTSKEKDTLILDDKKTEEIANLILAIQRRIYEIQNSLLASGRITSATITRDLKKVDRIN